MPPPQAGGEQKTVMAAQAITPEALAAAGLAMPPGIVPASAPPSAPAVPPPPGWAGPPASPGAFGGAGPGTPTSGFAAQPAPPGAAFPPPAASFGQPAPAAPSPAPQSFGAPPVAAPAGGSGPAFSSPPPAGAGFPPPQPPAFPPPQPAAFAPPQPSAYAPPQPVGFPPPQPAAYAPQPAAYPPSQPAAYPPSQPAAFPASQPAAFAASQPAAFAASQPAAFAAPGGLDGSAGHAPVAAAGARICGNCGTEVPANFQFCGACGSRLLATAAPMVGRTGTTGELAARAAPVAEPKPHGRLTLIRPDGSEGGFHELEEGENRIGRSHGVVFENDGYLSPLHAEVVVNAAGAVIRDVGSLNGVFCKMTQEEELSSGDVFRIGQELLRYDAIAPPQPLEDGTEIMGSPNPGYWGRLSVIIGRDIDGSAFPLFGDALTVGRERGDINFPDDGYVSGVHARISQRDGKTFIADLGSSNGTFVRLRGERVVQDGAFVLFGQQLFRLNLNVG
jgi:pSer/pThr/pTyr-binding forkhead associated (FHA) protein